MNEAPEPEPERPAYIRLPLPVVAVGLVVLLAGLLALGFYANRNLRPQTVVASTPAAAAAATATPLPIGAPPTAAVATPTLAPTPLVLVVSASPTAIPTPATSEPGFTTATPPTTSASPTLIPTVEPTLAVEVGNAYENFWRIRSEAALTLDSSHVSDVMDGPFLQHFVATLDQLKGEGRAIQTKVTLNYTVVQAASTSAVIHDRIIDDSFYVKAGTEEPESEPANDLLRVEVKLNVIDGKWKVVESVSAD